KALFAEIILRASQPKGNGGLGINAGFIEKDYWISKALCQLSRSDAKIKRVIRATEKSMAEGLTAIERPGLTSKGSRYRKSYYTYPSVKGIAPISSLLYGQLLIEINSFANPYPFGEHIVSSFL
ncbi:MAG: hypothetical protein ACI31D_06855, partial [Candidatus Limisoma sp.]